ncbi:Oxygen sensor histidine kinase NreB [Streptomyces sp. YIM 130001]|uniref:sensor histidine kinase n=1 Tax=Streptomyces sp. YIM 130001 TaxID=2259644 RepID=UPI000E64EF7D|nr:sensor histidine kinase [Streptomyces sp. YIM 130001]RII17029.1 Oxygen sensor histidine kinase NreB [Streptomyces sp. YIM 130001]
MTLGTRIRTAVRGLPAVPVALAELVLLILFVTGVALLGIGLGVLLVPVLAVALRATVNVSRRMAGRWSGTAIPEPYLPAPERGPGLKGRLQYTRWVLTDPATWRDLGWTLVNPVAGILLALLPVSLVLGGLAGVLMPAIYRPIIDANGGENWYLFVRVTDLTTAWYAAGVGLLGLLAGFAIGPWTLRSHAALARKLLAPTLTTRRVQQLTETRSDAVNSSAAELRRIERDLHDGAQARLVALGMNLGVAEQLLAKDPEAVGAILADTRKASATALTELRDLIRGIHPPVLADRGLADAVRALALDSPLEVTVNADLSGRPEAPVESAIYFAVSETLTNAAKHAAPDTVIIDLWYADGTLHGRVTDDGRGGADPSRGTGIRGIQRRLASFDGVLSVISPAGGPTTVTMEVRCALS